MTDYKSMYYHLAGRTATAVDVLEATTSMMEANAKATMANVDMMKASVDTIESNTKAMMANVESLVVLKEKLKLAQQVTEDMFINCDKDNSDDEETNEN